MLVFGDVVLVFCGEGAYGFRMVLVEVGGLTLACVVILGDLFGLLLEFVIGVVLLWGDVAFVISFGLVVLVGGGRLVFGVTVCEGLRWELVFGVFVRFVMWVGLVYGLRVVGRIGVIGFSWGNWACGFSATVVCVMLGGTVRTGMLLLVCVGVWLVSWLVFVSLARVV